MKQRSEQSASGSGGRPLDFSTYLMSLGATALVQLGQAPEPSTGRTEPDLDGARQTIDLLGILEAKTRGNLEEAEGRMLQHLLRDLRTKYMRAHERAERS